MSQGRKSVGSFSGTAEFIGDEDTTGGWSARLSNILHKEKDDH